MMPAIRRRFNYGSIVMTPELPEGERALCGQTVDVLLKSGDFERVHFMGFMSSTNALSKRRVQVFNIVAYNPEADVFNRKWVDIGSDCRCLGALDSDGVWLIVDDGVLCCWSPVA